MRGWRAIVLSVTGMVLTTSCGYAAAIHAAEIPQERLTGTWSSPAGTSLTFSGDHTFSGTGFDVVEAMTGCARRGTLSNGRWAFYAGDGPMDPDETVTRGHHLRLSFDGDPACGVQVYLYGDFGDPTDPSMCPTRDPDDGCPPGGYLTRERADSPS